MTAVTLAHVAKLETEPLRKGIIMNILRDARAMEVIPWENVDSLRSVAIRWTNLPTAAFRRINEGYTADHGDVEQVWESVYGFGGEINFDRVFDKIGNTIVSPRVLQTKMKLKALSLMFNDYLINGDHGTDEDGFEGLKKRVSLMPSRQSVYFAGSSSAALDPTASAANARAFLDKFDEISYRTNRGSVGAYFMNEGLYLGFARVLRYAQVAAGGAGALDVTRDSFDREIITYRGAKFIDMGLKRDQSTEIIAETETGGTGSANATSIYGVSFGTEQGVTGIQLGPLESYDPLAGGEQESVPAKLLRIDWWLGLAGFGSYGIVRGRNLEGAANWT
jgi:hypothetical protein